MKKKELLVPVGDMECLKQAVFNGCDAVYLACKNFGARKFAKNFTNDEILEAIKFCHLYGVRIYVTMNTLVKNNEVDDFLEQASFLHQNGVDALIVQDFGMICLLREMFPNLEIHASTQANISSEEVCKLYYNLGVKRVVFARELSIEAIESITVPIEKEVFIHGALCICYSGCCLMSSMLGGRSGNRGECAGVCRMPFSLQKGEKILREKEYLLSTKELNTTHKIERLLESNIDSFKIEGRMKSPLYVGFITNLYRQLLDGVNISLEKEEKKLKTIFNREFTEGHLFFTKEEDLINPKSPNHLGLAIGKVVGVTNKKVKIKLFPGEVLHQEDAIRFASSREGFIVNYLYDEKDNLISSTTNICFVDNKGKVEEDDIVLKTKDFLLEKEYEKIKPKKIPVSYKVYAKEKEPLKVEITDGIYTFIEEKGIVTLAEKIPVSQENIEKQLSKLGDTPFTCDKIGIEMDSNIFFPLHYLNEIRRVLTSKLISSRENGKINYLKKEVSFSKELQDVAFIPISCYVATKEQLEVCLKRKIDRIYTPNLSLYDEYQNEENIYYALPRCSFLPLENLKEKNLVSDYAFYSNHNIVGNYPLNITNIYTAYYLQKIGFSSLSLSVELSEEECLSFLEEYEKKIGRFSFEILGYGRVENMIIKGNILNLEKNKKDYQLIDSNEKKFPVYYDGKITHILNWKQKEIMIEQFREKCTIRLDFYNETREEVENILKRVQKK